MEAPELNKIYQGDVLEVLKTWPDEFIDCIVTSPPYWGLRDYGVDGQFGLEKTPEEYVAKSVEIFRECKRVLKKDGTLWLNLGDSYNGNGFSGGGYSDANEVSTLKPKDLVGIPWRVAFALQADGWYLRQDIIWAKPNPMPESVTDRCTKSHEYIFLMAKSKDYYFDNEAIKEKSVGSDPRMIDGFVPKSINGKHKDDPQNSANRKKYEKTMAGGGSSMINHNGYFTEDGEAIGTPGMRNKRDVWTVTTSPYPDAHFATFPQGLIVPMIKTTKPDAIILDPFMGSGTTAFVARSLGRKYLGIELNPAYIKLAERRLAQKVLF